MLTKTAWVSNGFYGCILNFNHTMRIKKYLSINGWKLTENLSHADLIIYSGCAVFNFYEKKALAEVDYILISKKTDAHFVVTGCLPQINKKSKISYKQKILSDRAGILESTIRDMSPLDKLIQARIPFAQVPHANSVDIKQGKNAWNFSIEAINEKMLRVRGKAYQFVYRVFSTTEKMMPFVDELSNSASDWISKKYETLVVGVGCSNACSYCAIKFSKGNIKSIPLESVMQQYFSRSRPKGKKFLILSDDLGSWGKDIDSNWIELLKPMAKANDKNKHGLYNLGIKDIIEAGDDFKEIITYRKIDFIMIAIQHVNPDVLKRMNRPYVDIDRMVDMINWLAEYKVDLLGHFICGFAGETEEQYADLVNFIKRIKNKNFHAYPFPYSPRSGTLAAKAFLNDEVNKKVALKRAHQIMRLNRARLLFNPGRWKQLPINLMHTDILKKYLR